jgi:hypothetical protein
LNDQTYTPPGLLISLSCKLDTCCVYHYLSLDLVAYFTDPITGQCNQNARAAVRLGFHDAGPWSRTSGRGGADGSILLAPTEYQRPVNNGLQAIRTKALALLLEYGIFGVTAADLVQFMATVATVTCPLGPRIRSFVGRETSSIDNPDGLMPNANDDAATIIDMFEDKTIFPIGLTALVGAHTSANQFFFDRTQAGKPLDDTPGVWDVRFYGDVLNQTVNP